MASFFGGKFYGKGFYEKVGTFFSGDFFGSDFFTDADVQPESEYIHGGKHIHRVPPIWLPEDEVFNDDNEVLELFVLAFMEVYSCEL